MPVLHTILQKREEQTLPYSFFYEGSTALIIKRTFWDFPGGPVVENPPSNAGDVDSIPGRGTKIPHAAGQLSPHALEPKCCNWKPKCHSEEPTRHNERSRVPQLRPNAAK